MGRCATVKSLCSIISKSLCNYKIPLVGQRRDAKGVNSLMQPASECVKVVDFKKFAITLMSCQVSSVEWFINVAAGLVPAFSHV